MYVFVIYSMYMCMYLCVSVIISSSDMQKLRLVTATKEFELGSVILAQSETNAVSKFHRNSKVKSYLINF